MKSLYICGTYCPAFGGAELSMHTFLKGIDSQSLVATDANSISRLQNPQNYEGIPLFGINHEHRKSELGCLIKNYKPDCIVTQLLWSDVALELSNENDIPSILRVCKIPFNLDISNGTKHSPTEIMVVSESVREYVYNNWNRHSTIILPPIDLSHVISGVDDNFNNRYITMFNPIKKKGGHIFREVAKVLENHSFAVVPGWDILKSTNGFDSMLIERLCESLRISYHGQKPSDVRLDDLHNMAMLTPTRHVREIYAQTRILCVPSQWQEAFGRVAIEGMANGIPIVGSAVGGLQEHVRKGGIVVKRYDDPSDWIRAIQKFQDRGYYQEVAERGKLFVKENYDINRILEQFNDLVKRVILND